MDQAKQMNGNDIDEKCVEAVQQGIRQMIAERIHPPQSMVEAIRDPGERAIVVAPVKGGEHPVKVIPAEPSVGGVEQQIIVITGADEIAAQRRKKS